MTFYIPVLVSILTAAAAAYATIRNTRVTTQTQREMVSLADRTAREFKDKDYKNDFYKKIIDKRLIAWEHAERFTELIGVSRNQNDTEEYFYQYFISGEEFRAMTQALVSLNARAFWLNAEYRGALHNFNNKLNTILKGHSIYQEIEQEPGDKGEAIVIMKIDDVKLLEAGKQYHAEFKVLTRAIINAQSAMLSTLHDIESFLAETRGMVF